MATEPTPAVSLFYCYAHKDKVLRDELDKHLKPLIYSGEIQSWYDGQISPGSEWAREIEKQLNSAHIVLLLISPDFIASDYCYAKEMQRALRRHEAGSARVIPIHLRHANWQGTPISRLQALPAEARPIQDFP